MNHVMFVPYSPKTNDLQFMLHKIGNVQINMLFLCSLPSRY